MQGQLNKLHFADAVQKMVAEESIDGRDADLTIASRRSAEIGFL